MSEDAPARGFSKGVNEYLTVSVALADAKATAFLAAALTIGAVVVNTRNVPGTAVVPRLLALAALAGCVATNAFVIIPRLPSGRRGLIFWEDIRSRTDADAYTQAVVHLTHAQAEVEYAAQNYFISDVLHRKHLWVRRGIVLFLLGAGFTAVAYLS